MLPHPQLDFFQALQPVELALPSATASGVDDTAAAPLPRPVSGAIAADDVVLEAGRVRIWYVPNPRAKSYRLALRPDGSGRCTVPRRGTLADARRFVERSRGWLAAQWAKRSALPSLSRAWQAGTPVWFRGRTVPLEVLLPPEHPVMEVRLAEPPDVGHHTASSC